MRAESSAATPGETRPARSPRTLALMLGSVTAPVIALDQASKLYISSRMRLYETIPLIPNWLDITYALNPGAAFSLFANLPERFRTVLLFALHVVAIVVILGLLARSLRPTLTSVALSLILAGAAGNLIDRALRGRVIDFVRAHYYSYNWPIFNVADSAITIGVAMILLSMLLSPRPDD